MIIRNLSLTSRKKCIQKYNFERDTPSLTYKGLVYKGYLWMIFEN